MYIASSVLLLGCALSLKFCVVCMRNLISLDKIQPKLLTLMLSQSDYILYIISKL